LVTDFLAIFISSPGDAAGLRVERSNSIATRNAADDSVGPSYHGIWKNAQNRRRAAGVEFINRLLDYYVCQLRSGSLWRQLGAYVGKSDSWKAGFGIAGNWDCSRRQGSPGSEETFAGGALGLPSDFSVRAETGKMRARWQNSLHPGHPAPVRNFRTTGFSRNSVVGAWGWFTKPRT